MKTFIEKLYREQRGEKRNNPLAELLWDKLENDIETIADPKYDKDSVSDHFRDLISEFSIAESTQAFKMGVDFTLQLVAAIQSAPLSDFDEYIKNISPLKVKVKDESNQVYEPKAHSFNSPEIGEIRTVNVDGRIYAFGEDVARALGYGQPSEAVATYYNEVVKRRIVTDNGEQDLITMEDVDRLIVNSELPSREKHDRWVSILPIFRKSDG